MSLDLKVYCHPPSAEIVPKMLKRLNDFDMIVAVHPHFRFDAAQDAGFVPFRFRFINPPHAILQGKELLSGFELYIHDFDLQAEKESLKPKLGFLARLRGRKAEEVAFAPPEMEELLAQFSKAVSFVWHGGDSFALRFASMTSAILAELTGGIRHYPADDIWYDNSNVVDEAYQEARGYEESMSEQELKFQEFDGW